MVKSPHLYTYGHLLVVTGDVYGIIKLYILFSWVFCMFLLDFRPKLHESIDWFKGKITGKSIISWENLRFPADFHLSQPIE